VPYLMDFAKIPDGRTPGGWVNTMGKFAVKTLKDGTKVLSKRNDAPSILIARANAYIGHPSLTNYTIEADVYATKLRTDLSDVGVGANRYTLLLMGNDQVLRLGTWDAQRRLEKDVKFAWKPNAWYTLKLTVEVDGDKATARGKVWERGAAEPKDWMVSVEDPRPNKEGSPLLYGYSKGIVDAGTPGTEVYYRRVQITPNKGTRDGRAGGRPPPQGR